MDIDWSSFAVTIVAVIIAILLLGFAEGMFSSERE